MNEDELKLMFEILETFDFEKVHKVMKFLDWKWSTEYDGMEIPPISSLYSHARKMIQKAIFSVGSGKEEYYSSCGGFTVEARMYGDDLSVNLYFCVDNITVSTEDIKDD